METVENYQGSGEVLPFRKGLFVVNQDGTGYLIANRCQHCGITFFPRRDFCIECYKSDNLKDVKLDTKGTLHTFTVVYRATPDFETPYIVGYVDLENDGVRVFAPIAESQPEDLRIGMKMELIFAKSDRIPKDKNDKKQLTYKFRLLK